MANSVQAQKLDRRNSLTQARLRELLSYDPTTGQFTWLVMRTNKARPGSKAGYVSAGGYLAINIDKISYLAHRLAWLYVHGKWPERIIDHIDCDKQNNSISNLREADRRQNRANSLFARSNTLRGASQLPSGRWSAQIGYMGKILYLGSFDTETEAHAAYSEKAKEFFGEFARVE